MLIHKGNTLMQGRKSQYGGTTDDQGTNMMGNDKSNLLESNPISNYLFKGEMGFGPNQVNSNTPIDGLKYNLYNQTHGSQYYYVIEPRN